jgi:poly(A) polymerase/tRNA nucleotidyltransferase (CCA-adding enzyme)
MNIPATVKEFAKVFNKNGYAVYLVGGALRDQLLGKKNSDFDFTTDAHPEEVMKIFSNTVPVGIEHGTVLVLFKGSQYEVTTFRTEGTYSDSRHPDRVEFVRTIDEDLKRRDFTINAFAWNIEENQLIDQFSGQEDLKHRLIKAIGNPDERFTEDPLRMLRACRFAARLEFSIEEKTLESITRLSENIRKISAERVRDELIKMVTADRPSIGFEYMRITGLLKYIIPELLYGYQVVQNRFHRYDVYYHNLFSCDAAPKKSHILPLAALFHDISKPQTKKEKPDENSEGENSFYNHEIIGARTAGHILRRLRFSNEEVKRITHLIKHHMFYYTDEWTDGAVRRFIRNVGLDNLEDLFSLRDADRIGNGTKQGIPKTFLDFKDRIRRILEIDSALKVTDLYIDGNILMKELKIKPGPVIGEILNYLLELVLDDPQLNDPAVLLEKALEYYQKKESYAQENFNTSCENLGNF